MNTPTLPSRPVTSPRFRYVPAVQTDVRRTWRKARLMQFLARPKDQQCAS